MNYFLLQSNYNAVCTLNTSTTGSKTVTATSAINSAAVVSQIYRPTTPLTISTINRPVNQSEVVATEFSCDIRTISKQGVLNMSCGNSGSARSTVCR